MSVQFPHIDIVPRDLEGNKKWRRKLYASAETKKGVISRERLRCQEDFLYYVNAYCFTFDPRKEPSCIPFCTYEFQDRAAETIIDCIPDRDLLIEKSRDMGASWLILTIFEWFWHFHGGKTFLLVSRNEDYVDKIGDPKSLFWKIDYLHDHQPEWLLPRKKRKKLHLGNSDNGSTIDGESTTGDVARGDRRTAIMLDEFAAVKEGAKVLAATTRASNCRIFNSTPQGTGNAFYDVAHSGKVRKIRFHWSEHPERNAGAYRDSYGKWTSPWYQTECASKTSAVEIAQELDIDYMGSGSPFFDSIMIEDLKRAVRAPLHVGDMHFDLERELHGHWQPMQGGLYKLWVQLSDTGLPPPEREYAIGADVATGKAHTYGSNSVMSVVDRMSGIKVAEMATPSMSPDDFAHHCLATGRFFNNAILVWEANGPGGAFGSTVADRGYPNIFMRKRGDVSGKKQFMTAPGWWANKDTKRALLGDYAINLRNQKFKNWSIEAVNELQYYQYGPGGKVSHSRSDSGPDLSGCGENHGDRVIADALANLALRAYPQVSPAVSARKYEHGSFGHRRQQRKRKKRLTELAVLKN